MLNVKIQITLLCVLLLSFSGRLSADVVLVDYVDFENGGFPNGWQVGSQYGGTHSILADTLGQVPNSTKSYRAGYPAPGGGGAFTWLGINVADLDSNHIAIDFWAKMPSKTKHGLKFVKLFGKSSTEGGYANVTFGLDYTGSDNGGMTAVSFGDGSQKQNDTGNVIFLGGGNPEWVGRSYGHAEVETPQNSAWGSNKWGTDWHHFRFRVKFNSGDSVSTEVADGEIYVEIDGEVYVDAKKLFNRNHLNGNFRSIELGGWSQSGTEPFEIWYDNITVTSGGFYNNPKMSSVVLDAPN